MIDNTLERIRKCIALVRTIPGARVHVEQRIVVVPMLDSGRNCVETLKANGFTVVTK